MYEILHPTYQVAGGTSSDIKPTVLPSPTIPAGEDETSFERHNNQIKAEFSKKRKEKSGCSYCFNCTNLSNAS